MSIFKQGLSALFVNRRKNRKCVHNFKANFKMKRLSWIVRRTWVWLGGGSPYNVLTTTDLCTFRINTQCPLIKKIVVSWTLQFALVLTCWPILAVSGLIDDYTFQCSITGLCIFTPITLVQLFCFLVSSNEIYEDSNKMLYSYSYGLHFNRIFQ